MSFFLVVGLGNPGKEYVYTRHNIGFRVLESFAKKKNTSFQKKKKQALFTSFEEGEKTVFLIWPQTYMNLSGDAVKKWVRFLKIPKEHVLVITDDAEIPFGKLRFRKKGSSGGHNGLKSIEDALKSQEYARLRWGVGRDEKRDLADFVLEEFTKEEEQQVPLITQRAIEEIEKWLQEL